MRSASALGSPVPLEPPAWLIATPLAYIGVQEWMKGFSYQSDIGIGPYLLSGGITILVAWLTISYQSVRTARADPVDTLRWE